MPQSPPQPSRPGRTPSPTGGRPAIRSRWAIPPPRPRLPPSRRGAGRPGPYDLDSQPEGWLDEMRARHPEEGQWVEIGEYEEAGGGLRWKSLAQVRNETAQVKGKAERVAAKRRAKRAGA